MVLETTSSHLPYMDPLGGEPTAENVWSYVDGQLFDFYNSLQETSFFENGILIVTADHREMVPVKPIERRKYGGSAEFRGGLLIIGRGIPSGRIDDRYLQQADLLALIEKIPDETLEFTRPIFLTQLYKKPIFGEGESINRVIEPELGNGHSPYNLVSTGGKITFIGRHPELKYKDKIARTYHRWGSRLQRCKKSSGNC